MPADHSTEDSNLLEKARALQHYRTIRNAFVELFGPPGKRTPQGQVVLDHLEIFCGSRRLINELTNDGATDVPRTFRKHGRADVMQAIHDAIEWKEPINGGNSG